MTDTVLPTVVVTASRLEIPQIDVRERLPSAEENHRLMGDLARSTIWTSLVCFAEEVYPATGTIDAQPAIQGVQLDDQGNRVAVNMPKLVDVPILFQNGGGCHLTFPVQKGDECLVFFAGRDIDSWWETGSISPPLSKRTLSLSDGFALVGPKSKNRVIPDISTTESTWRNTDNSAGIYFNPTTGHITIKAPGGLSIIADTTQTGTISASGDVQAGNVSLKSHLTSEVQSGSSNSGPPVGGG